MKFGSIFLAMMLVSPLAMASEKAHFEITIKDHKFSPEEITVPANTKVTLKIINKDNSFEEFHSDSLRREKVVGANSSGVVNIGPLKPGTYPFMGEFHAQTAQGRVIAK